MVGANDLLSSRRRPPLDPRDQGKKMGSVRGSCLRPRPDDVKWAEKGWAWLGDSDNMADLVVPGPRSVGVWWCSLASGWAVYCLAASCRLVSFPSRSVDLGYLLQPVTIGNAQDL